MFKHDKVDFGYDDLKSQTSYNGRLYESPKGLAYPSITTVLSILSRDSILEWRKRVGEEEANRIGSQAARRGTAVHDMAEQYIKNNPDWKLNALPHILESFLPMKQKLDKHLGTVYAQEVALYSEYLGVAGRVDCIAEWDGKISVIDFKTSKKLKREEWIESYFMQEAFYAIAFEERTTVPITQLVTLIAVDNEEPQIFIENRNSWTKGLISTIKKYKEEKGL